MRRWARTVLSAALVATPVIWIAGPAQAATTAALWHMESTSSMTDSAGNNTGKPVAVTSVAGSSGKGYHFNGKNSVVNVPDSPTLDPGTANLRVTVHVRFSVVPSGKVEDYDLIRKGVTGTTGGDWRMEIYPPSRGSSLGTAFCQFQDAKKANATIRDTRNLADGKWHTIACLKTASTIQVIVDGVARSKSVRLGSISNSQPLALGAKPGGGDQYLGDMDEVSIQIG